MAIKAMKRSAAKKASRTSMGTCEVCGNRYDKAFQVVLPPASARGSARATAGESHTFDSFECAIHALAPVCDHCGCRVVGHGVESDGSLYCCAHCARESGEQALRDRA